MKDISPILLHYGLVIREVRLEKAMSQEELANRSGLHRTYITDIEHGSRNISLKNVLKISRAIDTPLHEIFERVEQFSQNGLNLIAQNITKDKLRRKSIEILFIEDDQHCIDLTMRELQNGSVGNRVHIIRDGIAAEEFLFGQKSSKTGINFTPKVILFNVEVPDGNGIKLLERIRKDKQTTDIPVVIISSPKFDIDKERYKKLGVEYYLEKPINLVDFDEVMCKLGFQWLLIAKSPASN